jgi:hypothetical protein
MRMIEMFVIPAAGPGDTQAPDISALDGVVRDGPQEPTKKAPIPTINSLDENREKRIIELEEWALQDSSLRPSDYEFEKSTSSVARSFAFGLPHIEIKHLGKMFP